jgi:hypothetical protein
MHASITSLAWLHLNQLMYLLYNGTSNVTLFAPYEVSRLVCTQDPSNDREANDVNMRLVMTFMTSRTLP